MPKLDFTIDKIENKDNKITSTTRMIDDLTYKTILNDQDTDGTYPSSKVVYDTIQEIVTEHLANFMPAAADYIVEQEIGNSGSWTYRKWNSGISECWTSLTSSSQARYGTNYLGNNQVEYSYRTLPFPTELFIETPMVFATGTGTASEDHTEAGMVGVTIGSDEVINSTKEFCNVCIYGLTDMYNDNAVNVHAIGRWK
jgi:hypothetical protein